MQFVKNEGITDQVSMASKTPGFVVDHEGYVICTTCQREKPTTFEDSNLEIYAFVMSDGRAVSSQLYDSTVQINSINLGDTPKPPEVDGKDSKVYEIATYCLA